MASCFDCFEPGWDSQEENDVDEARYSLVTANYEWTNGVESALRDAALNGHPACMLEAKKRGATGFALALNYAAYGGRIACMELAEEWLQGTGVAMFELYYHPIGSTLICAARGGSRSGMRWARGRGAESLDLALFAAAEHGHADCMLMLAEWGATNFEGALAAAALAGCAITVEIALTLGATDVDTALEIAVREYHADCACILLNHGAQPITKERNVWRSMLARGLYDTDATLTTFNRLVEGLARRIDSRQLVQDLPQLASINEWMETTVVEVIDQRAHATYLDACIALIPLDLPVYVVHWILEWVEPHGLSLVQRVRLLETVRKTVCKMRSAAD